MVERQLRCDLLRLILVAGWFVPFWRDTDRRWESGGATNSAPVPGPAVAVVAAGSRFSLIFSKIFQVFFLTY